MKNHTSLGRLTAAIATVVMFAGACSPAFAADRYWSGGSGSSDLIDQGANWYGGTNPSSGDNLYFNNTVNRHWAQSNYGAGSYFGSIVTYNGAGGIKWLGDFTSAYKFENNNDSNLFEIAANIGNRSGPDVDLELNPVGGGGIKVTGTVNITGGKQIKVYGDNTLTLNGSVNGSGASLAIQNAATVILEASNSYTGVTQINAGTLTVNGSTHGSSQVSMGTTGTLKGSGTVGGMTTVSGTHAVGNNGVGKQTFGSDLSYAGSSSIFEWELGSETTSGRGTVFDAVDVAGGLSVSNSVFKIIVNGLDIAGMFWDAPTLTWDVFNKGSTGTFRTFQLFSAADLVNPVGYSGQGAFSFDATTGDLKWTAVPEPSGMVAGLLIAAGMLRRKRG